MRTGAGGAPVCVTVTLRRRPRPRPLGLPPLDELPLRRRARHARALVEGDEEKTAALEAFTEKLVPGRWPEVRWPTRQELKGTKVLSLPIDEASAKVRTGGPVDDAEDYALDVWAGVVPLSLAAGRADRRTRMAPVPDHVRDVHCGSCAACCQPRAAGGDGLRIET